MDEKKLAALLKEAEKYLTSQRRDELKEQKRLQKEVEKEKLIREKEITKIAEREKLNKTHDISISQGIKYCKYCGDTDGFGVDCNRELGHKYSVKRVVTSYSTEYKPVCSRCGLDKWCYNCKCG